MSHTQCMDGHASNQASAVDRTDGGPGKGGHIQESALGKSSIVLLPLAWQADQKARGARSFLEDCSLRNG